MHRAIDAANVRARHEIELAHSAAWHAAAFGRVKQLHPWAHYAAKQGDRPVVPPPDDAQRADALAQAERMRRRRHKPKPKPKTTAAARTKRARRSPTEDDPKGE